MGAFQSSEKEEEWIIKRRIDRVIEESTVVVFGLSYSAACIQAENVMSLLSLDPHEVKIINFDLIPQRAIIKEYLKQKYGKSTIPNIFINGRHVGGLGELRNASRNTGGLLNLIQEAAPVYSIASERSDVA